MVRAWHFMRFQLRFWILALTLALFCGSSARRAGAHPMGNFSINHYARFEAHPGFLALRTVIDFAEIPTTERMAELDANGDQNISDAEKRAFLNSEIAANARGYAVQINGKKAEMELKNSRLEILPGAGGLQTLQVIADWQIALPASAQNRVAFADSNFEGRNGWMEIIAVAARGQKIVDSDAAATDRSHELATFPISGGTVAPRQREAQFSVVSSAIAAGKPSGSVGVEPSSAVTAQNPRADAPATNTRTPQNGFTQSIAAKQLTPGLILGGLLAALAFGAVHALSPGHGKTMVAAYLVGSRGTPRHAVLLGIVVTLTHTLSVFALGIGLLFASNYVLPERLFPVLSATSGLLIFGVGLWLFMSRYQDLRSGNGHSQPHSHDHAHDHSHGDEDDHDHGAHPHESDTHTHSHGGREHSHAVPDGPITLKTLVALGISGGIVPCPEALVVLLAAVKLGRLGYGMLLITAFSVGLAAALIAIGLVVVAARERFGSVAAGKGGALARYLPVGSAAAITVIGIVLTLQATTGGP